MRGTWVKGIMSTPSKRREMDVMKLMMSDFKVEMVNDRMSEFYVEFHGPRNSLYQEGTWKISVGLPEAYPYKCPSIRFGNRIFHPNVDEISMNEMGVFSPTVATRSFLENPSQSSGIVCLNVIDTNWSPMFDLMNIFEVFLPQLLLYPNTDHGLNNEAIAMMMSDRERYEQKVKEHCERYAKLEDIGRRPEEGTSDVGVSEDEEYMSSDEEVAGPANP